MEGSYLNRYRQVVFGGIVLFLIMFVIQTAMYMSVIGDFSVPRKWLQEISVKCPIDNTQQVLVFHDAVYAEYGFVFYVLGAFIGLAYDAKYFKGTIRKVNSTGTWATLKRILLMIVPLFLVFVLPVFFIGQKRWTLGVLLTKYASPSFLAGFLLFGCSKVIYAKFGLVNLEDKELEAEGAMNLGKFEEQEEQRELRGKSASKLVVDGY